jgi:NAD(P)-dependent dehydrogenase (short-subunit alcohol dehydrogenase family)
MKLLGKVAIVTGSGRGIGKGIAMRFANEGAQVLVAEMNAEWGIETVQEIREQGGEATFIETDVTDLEQVKLMTDNCEEHFGKVDILVNNAGITGVDKNILEMSYETWKRAIDNNLSSLFLCTQAAAKLMVKHGVEGSIINIASINSYAAQKNAIHYIATKGAIPLFTKSTAVDLSEYNIRANAIAPGMISTERTGPRLLDPAYKDMVQRVVPLKRTGQVNEVAALATFLASDESRYIQGETILIDGGLLAFLRLE